jgi:hypothetical protein
MATINWMIKMFWAIQKMYFGWTKKIQLPIVVTKSWQLNFFGSIVQRQEIKNLIVSLVTIEFVFGN